MDIGKVECFIEVAKLLNFSKTESQLHISNQALSRQTHLLENELGVKFMEHSTTLVIVGVIYYYLIKRSG